MIVNWFVGTDQLLKHLKECNFWKKSAEVATLTTLFDKMRVQQQLSLEPKQEEEEESQASDPASNLQMF